MLSPSVREAACSKASLARVRLASYCSSAVSRPDPSPWSVPMRSTSAMCASMSARARYSSVVAIARGPASSPSTSTPLRACSSVEPADTNRPAATTAEATANVHSRAGVVRRRARMPDGCRSPPLDDDDGPRADVDAVVVIEWNLHMGGDGVRGPVDRGAVGRAGVHERPRVPLPCQEDRMDVGDRGVAAGAAQIDLGDETAGGATSADADPVTAQGDTTGPAGGGKDDAVGVEHALIDHVLVIRGVGGHGDAPDRADGMRAGVPELVSTGL